MRSACHFQLAYENTETAGIDSTVLLKTNSVDFSLQANYIGRASAAGLQN
jgi:hypothetical protein